MHGPPPTWVALYLHVIAAGNDLRSRLEALIQVENAGADPADVKAVRTAHDQPQRGVSVTG